MKLAKHLLALAWITSSRLANTCAGVEVAQLEVAIDEGDAVASVGVVACAHGSLSGPECTGSPQAKERYPRSKIFSAPTMSA